MAETAFGTVKKLLDGAKDLDTTSEVIRYERKHLEAIKEGLKNIIKRLRKKLKAGEHIELCMFMPDYYMARIGEDGVVDYIEADCEGSWTGNTSLDKYFKSVETLEDAKILYRTFLEQAHA